MEAADRERRAVEAAVEAEQQQIEELSLKAQLVCKPQGCSNGEGCRY